MRRLLKAKRKINSVQGRTRAVSIIYMLMGFFIVVRLFFLQVIEFPLYDAMASGQHDIFQQLVPTRGEIYAQTENGLYPLAINRSNFVVYAVPSEIKDPQAVAELLLPWLKELQARGTEPDEEEIKQLVEIEPSESEITAAENQAEEEAPIDPELASLIKTLSKNKDPYEPLIKGVTKEDLAILQDNNVKGVYWTPIASRYYPENNIGSHLIGFFSSLSDEQKGQYGLEGYWDELLRGREGILRSEKDAKGTQISIAPQTLHKAKDGADLILTIDPAIQYTACSKLEEYVDKFSAVGGGVIILDPNNGKILAMCGYPDFDPNHYNKVESIQVYKNPLVSVAYEPGSIMKSITMAAGLDSGLVKPDDTYYDEGEVKIAGYTIRNSDFKSHGNQTMINILEKSLNTGAIYIANKLGPKLLKKYFEDFGFGEKSGVELSNEMQGDISSLDKKGIIYAATASYGQGITVTPLQMAAAYVPIANGGILYKPYIVDKVVYPDNITEQHEPHSIRQVISPQTSALLSGMLVSVVKNGHAVKAGVAGHLVAGKTGTALIPGPDGKYTKETFQSFVGFAPVDKPRFVILTILDRPQVNYAADSAAPLFSEIADFILKYYHVPPTELK